MQKLALSLQLPTVCVSPFSVLNFLQTRVSLLLLLLLATVTTCTLIPTSTECKLRQFSNAWQRLNDPNVEISGSLFILRQPLIRSACFECK